MQPRAACVTSRCAFRHNTDTNASFDHSAHRFETPHQDPDVKAPIDPARAVDQES
jgi:hypothetical protein